MTSVGSTSGVSVRAFPGLGGIESGIVAALQQAVIATDLNGRILLWNPFAQKLYGWRAEEVIGRDILEVTPSASSRDEAQQIMVRLQNGDSWSGDITLQHRDGHWFRAHVTDTPLLDEGGEMVGIVGFSVRSEAKSERQLEVINGELRHQVRNVFALVSAIVSQTLRSVVEGGRLTTLINGRIAAVAAAHNLMDEPAAAAMNLPALMEAVVAPLAPTASRLVMTGGEVRLPRASTAPLALILHELATNAIKHGAWCHPDGIVAVTWTIGEGKRLDLNWREETSVAPEVTDRKGFGSRLLERGLPNAEVEHELTPNGFRCRILLGLDPSQR